MTAYNVINPSSMVAGQPEDVSVILANLNAIAAVINGGLDNSNLSAAAAILASKLAGYPSDGTMALRGDGTWGSVVADQAINSIGTTTYTPVVSDKNKLLMFTNNSAIAFTVPANATPFPTGASFDIIQWGTGQITFGGASGVSIGFNPGNKTIGQYAMATLVKVGSDLWALVGALTP